MSHRPPPSDLQLMSEQDMQALTEKKPASTPPIPVEVTAKIPQWQLDEVQATEKKTYVRKTTCPKCHFDQPESLNDICVQCGVAMRKYAEQLQKQLALAAGELDPHEEEEDEENTPQTLKTRLQETLMGWFGSGISEELKLAEQAGLLTNKKATRRKKATKIGTTADQSKTTTAALEEKGGITHYETLKDKEEADPTALKSKPGLLTQLKARIIQLGGSETAKEAANPVLPHRTTTENAPKESITRYETSQETLETTAKAPANPKTATNAPATKSLEHSEKPAKSAIKSKKQKSEGVFHWLHKKNKNTVKTESAQPSTEAAPAKTAAKTAKPLIPTPTDPQQELALMVNRNITYYLKQFEEFQVIDETGAEIDEFSATWNWAAFWVPFIWFLYRKQYLWSIIALSSMIMPVIANIIWGLSANYLYYRHLKKQITAIKAVTLKTRLGQALHQAGGVHMSVAIFSSLAGGLLFITLAGYTIIVLLSGSSS